MSDAELRPEAAAPVPPVAPVRPRRVLRTLLLVLLTPVLLLVLAIGALLASLRTEAGTRWWIDQLASRVNGVEASGAQGALLGADGNFGIDRLRVTAGGAQVSVRGLAWQGLRLAGWQRTAPFVDLRIELLRAQSLDIVPPPARPDAPALKAPASLALPLTAQIDALQIDRLTIAGVPAPIEALRARIELGAVHRISNLALRWNGLALDANASLGAAAPLPLDAALALRSAPDTDPNATTAPGLLPVWAKGLAASLQTRGPLAGFDAQAAFFLQGQRLDASARVTAFDKLPLDRLDSRFTQLDLQPLAALLDVEAPATRLDGDIKLRLASAGALAVEARITNALPGAWDQHRVPVAALDLNAAGSGQHWKIGAAEARLVGRNGAPAGRLKLDGNFDLAHVPTGELQLRLDAVSLGLLDARAPPLRLSGPLRLQHRAATDADAAFGSARLEVDLAGALTGDAARTAPAALRNAPVRLELSAELDPRRLDLSRLRAVSGAGSLQGTLQFREGSGLWSGNGRLALARFNPAQWLPGNPNASWRLARNELSGVINLQGRAPLPGDDMGAWLERLEASLDATLGADSRIAGVALSGSAEVRGDGRGALGGRAELAVAGNSARSSFSLDGVNGNGGDRIELRLDAPYLNRAAALAEAAGIKGLAGSAHLHAEVAGGLGAWLLPGARGGAPAAVRTRGVAEIDALRATGIRLDRLHGRWNMTVPPRPLRGTPTEALEQALIGADLRAEKLQLPGVDLPALAFHIDGTLAAHRAVFRTLVQPPPLDDGSTDPTMQTRAVDLELNGAWHAETGDRQRWQGTIKQLLVQTLAREQARTMLPTLLAPAKAKDTATDDLPTADLPTWPALPLRNPLLVARDVTLEAVADPAGFNWAVTPGRADLAGAALAWKALRGVHASGASPLIDATVDLEPFELIVLLKRLRPDVGWAGDLRIGGRLDLHSSARGVKLDFELGRTSGDLAIAEFGSQNALGLSEALIGISAEGGRWRLVQRLAGSNLGRIDSDIELQTAPQALFPGRDATLTGRIDARVESLSGWAAWVPAGWRLAGQIDAGLQLAGSVGAPNVKGAITGRDLGLRNTLVGVNLTEGVLDFALEGETATLRTLRFRAGDGSVEAKGDSRLGADPQSRIAVTARQATLLGRVDRRIVISGDAQARLAPSVLGVRGKFTVDEGLIDISQADAPRLGDDVTVIRGGISPDDPAVTAAAGAGRNTELDLVINLGERLRLQGRGIGTNLVGELHLTTPRGVLRADGEIRTERGMYEAFGQRLAIDRGVITFVGDIANPRLDIEAIRPNLDTRVGARISGSAKAPRVRLFSEPEMSDIEKLALLITGRPYDNLGGTDTLIMQRAALAMLGGESGNSGVVGALRLDEFSIRQTDGTTRDTIIAVGKQVSDRLYVGFERGLNETAGAVQLTYRIGNRFTLRAQSGTNSALDLIWLFRWD